MQWVCRRIPWALPSCGHAMDSPTTASRPQGTRWLWHVAPHNSRPSAHGAGCCSVSVSPGARVGACERPLPCLTLPGPSLSCAWLPRARPGPPGPAVPRAVQISAGYVQARAAGAVAALQLPSQAAPAAWSRVGPSLKPSSRGQRLCWGRGPSFVPAPRSDGAVCRWQVVHRIVVQNFTLNSISTVALCSLVALHWSLPVFANP